jgi:hypothetical protein
MLIRAAPDDVDKSGTFILAILEADEKRLSLPSTRTESGRKRREIGPESCCS